MLSQNRHVSPHSTLTGSTPPTLLGDDVAGQGHLIYAGLLILSATFGGLLAWIQL